jgi:hypothetical protein
MTHVKQRREMSDALLEQVGIELLEQVGTLHTENERLKRLLRAALPAVRWDAGDDSLAHDIERALEGK